MDPTQKSPISSNNPSETNPGINDALQNAEPMTQSGTQPVPPSQSGQSGGQTEPMLRSEYPMRGMPAQRVSQWQARQQPVVDTQLVNASRPAGPDSMISSNIAPNPNITNQPVFINSNFGATGGNAKKRKNKTLIAILIALGILSVVTLIGVIVIGSIGNPTLNKTNARSSFNEYANYFLYGEDGKGDVTATYADPADSYFIRNAGKWESPEYIPTFTSLFNNFYSIYSEEIANDSELTAWANNYARGVDLVAKYYNVGVPFLQGVADTYTKEGKEGTREEIISSLRPYQGIGEFSGVAFYDEVIELTDEYLRQVEIYSDSGCIMNGEVNYNCVLSDEARSTVAEIETKTANLENDLLSTVHDCENKLYGGIFGFKREIYDEQETNEEE